MVEKLQSKGDPINREWAKLMENFFSSMEELRKVTLWLFLSSLRIFK